MLQKLFDGRAEYIEQHGKEPVKVTLNYDEGFKLLEEIRKQTKGKKPYTAMTKVLLSRNEKDLVEIFKGSNIFGMSVEIKGTLHV